MPSVRSLGDVDHLLGAAAALELEPDPLGLLFGARAALDRRECRELLEPLAHRLVIHALRARGLLHPEEPPLLGKDDAPPSLFERHPRDLTLAGGDDAPLPEARRVGLERRKIRASHTE